MAMVVAGDAVTRAVASRHDKERGGCAFHTAVASGAITRDATSQHKEEEEVAACVLSMAGARGAATRDATSQHMEEEVCALAMVEASDVAMRAVTS